MNKSFHRLILQALVLTLLAPLSLLAQDCSPRVCEAMRTVGNVLYSSKNAEAVGLPIGTTGQVLVVASNGIPSWSSSVSGITGPLTLTGALTVSNPGSNAGIVVSQTGVSSVVDLTDGTITGRLRLITGDRFYVGTTSATPLALMTSGNQRWSIDTSGQLTQDGTNGGDVIFNATSPSIRQGTSDAADSKSMQITGGGAYATDGSRGAYLFLNGNELAGAGGRAGLFATNGEVLQIGTIGNSSLQIYTNNLSRLTLDNAGNFNFDGTNGGNIVFSKTLTGVSGLGKLALERTVTAGGTTGAQTINKIAGTVNFAAGASSVVVTDSQVTATSLVLAVIRTADATLTTIKSVVPASGSFTITGNANATAETSVGFIVTN